MKIYLYFLYNFLGIREIIPRYVSICSKVTIRSGRTRWLQRWGFRLKAKTFFFQRKTELNTQAIRCFIHYSQPYHYPVHYFCPPHPYKGHLLHFSTGRQLFIPPLVCRSTHAVLHTSKFSSFSLPFLFPKVALLIFMTYCDIYSD